MRRDRQDAGGLLVTTSILARHIMECCTPDEAHFLGDFFINLGSNLLFLCRYPDPCQPRPHPPHKPKTEEEKAED